MKDSNFGIRFMLGLKSAILDPRVWWECSNKLGSLIPFLRQFPWIGSSVFFWNLFVVLVVYVGMCMTAASFGKLLSQKWENWPNIEFFEFIDEFGDLFSLNFVYNESSHYLIYLSTNTIFGNLIPEICVKMPLANQIAGVLNF